MFFSEQKSAYFNCVVTIFIHMWVNSKFCCILWMGAKANSRRNIYKQPPKFHRQSGGECVSNRPNSAGSRGNNFCCRLNSAWSRANFSSNRPKSGGSWRSNSRCRLNSTSSWVNFSCSRPKSAGSWRSNSRCRLNSTWSWVNFSSSHPKSAGSCGNFATRLRSSESPLITSTCDRNVA